MFALYAIVFTCKEYQRKAVTRNVFFIKWGISPPLPQHLFSRRQQFLIGILYNFLLCTISVVTFFSFLQLFKHDIFLWQIHPATTAVSSPRRYLMSQRMARRYQVHYQVNIVWTVMDDKEYFAPTRQQAMKGLFHRVC